MTWDEIKAQVEGVGKSIQKALTRFKSASEAGLGPPPKGKRRFTVFAKFPGGSIEEIDIDATREHQVRPVAEEILRRDYEPGWKIVRIEERHGMYM